MVQYAVTADMATGTTRHHERLGLVGGIIRGVTHFIAPVDILRDSHMRPVAAIATGSDVKLHEEARWAETHLAHLTYSKNAMIVSITVARTLSASASSTSTR